MAAARWESRRGRNRVVQVRILTGVPPLHPVVRRYEELDTVRVSSSNAPFAEMAELADAPCSDRGGHPHRGSNPLFGIFRRDGETVNTPGRGPDARNRLMGSNPIPGTTARLNTIVSVKPRVELLDPCLGHLPPHALHPNIYRAGNIGFTIIQK